MTNTFNSTYVASVNKTFPNNHHQHVFIKWNCESNLPSELISFFLMRSSLAHDLLLNYDVDCCHAT